MAESNLSFRENTFETAMETMAQAIVIMDKNLKIVYFNQKYKILFEHTDEELFIGADYVDLIKIWVKRYGVTDGIYDRTIKNLHSRSPLVTELNQNEFSHKDAYWIQMFHNPLPGGGAVRTFEDITARKIMEDKLRKGEEQYRLLADNSRDVIWTMNLEGRFTYVSPSIERLLGYTAEGFLIEPINNLVTQESALIIRRYFEEIHDFIINKEKLPYNIVEIEHIHKDGSRVWTEVNTNIMYNSKNKFVGILGVSRDISERKKIEEQMRLNTNELRELNATKDKFFSIIAHDLKNPFHGILTFSKVLSTEYNSLSPLDIQHSAGIIHRVAADAYSLLENLLEWAQSQTGKFAFRPEKLYLNYQINKQIELNNEAADRKNISLSCEIENDIFVFVDENMIKTVLRNLISNAIKFSPKKGKVLIRAISKDKFAEISVIDNGIGITAENVKKLFRTDAHFTVKGTENEPGTGLGLILCKEFVEKNGGEIKVCSEENKGSKFIFTLPLFFN